MILNFVITVVQIVGGILSGSLALISDALHNFSDGISIIISYIAIRLKRRDNSYKHTFGLKRAEILAAVINASVLIVIYVFLFYESFIRFYEPKVIEAYMMTIVAAIGLVANIVGTLLLKRDSKNSINIRSSYMHLLSDSVSSVAVILGGIAISVWSAWWVDPFLTILIGLYIIKESYDILGEAIHVLMEGAPPDISLDAIKEEVEKFSEVEDIHHIHVWTVGDNDVHLEAHVNVNDMKVSESDQLRMKIEQLFESKFGIHHITLQFECNSCPENGLLGKHK
ncbi:MAG: cation transporter [Ignavibacteriae bacterium HGW-Ignavibacteriae-3]|nr:MAG: cation transporter [Ignavibacteriae bacterium HGW-Ignavibacteriae-3]